MNFIRLSWFHLKIYSKNKYFLTAMIISTLSMLLLQYIIAYSNNNLSDPTIWVRAGIFGMWSTVVTSAGMIGFQRFQGTLPYLLSNKVSDNVSLLALLIPCSLFGLLAFPLSYVVCAFSGIYVDEISASLIISILLLFLGALSYTIVIAPMFVLTKNAIVYEQLISIPILLVSGIFLFNETGNSIVEKSKWVNPITIPITNLLYDEKIVGIQYIVAISIWIVIAYILSRYIFNLVKISGKIEVI